MDFFTNEFGFLPPELLFKSHEFVRAYHDRRGSGWLFVKPSILSSRHSPYLASLERTCLLQFRLLKIALAFALVAAAVAIVVSYWLFILTVGALFFAYIMLRNIKFNLIQIRSLILSNEILASDFAGWGRSFPQARERAIAWLATGEPGDLLNIYMPPNERHKFIGPFQCSGRSDSSRA
jgi:hypothetical protein